MKKYGLLIFSVMMLSVALFSGEKEIIELKKETYQEVLQSSKYVVVDVYASWCGPCKMLAPVLKNLNDQYGHVYRFAKLEASEQNRDFIESLRVTAFPTVIFYDNGKEVGRNTGFLDGENFLKTMKKYFAC